MKKNLVLLIMLLAATQLFSQREETLLKDWQFCMEQQANTMPETGWQQVSIPHDWAITGPFSRDNDLQEVAITQNGSYQPSVRTGRTGGLPYIGAAWYRTTIKAPFRENVVLLFDGAMSEAEVFVNGKKAIFWPYGYNAFWVDITPYIYNGKNEIAVHLENRPESSRWYPGAGLYRNVHLIQTGKTHIPVWGVQIKKTLPVKPSPVGLLTGMMGNAQFLL